MIHWIGLIYQHLLLYRFTTYSMNVSPNQRIHIYYHKNGDEKSFTTHLYTKDDLKYCECLYSVYSFIIYAYCSFPSSMIKTLWTTRCRSWPVCTVKNFWPLEAEKNSSLCMTAKLMWFLFLVLMFFSAASYILLSFIWPLYLVSMTTSSRSVGLWPFFSKPFEN